MKAYICDQCQKREQPDNHYDLPPKGWFTLNESMAAKTQHLCGPICLQDAAIAIIAAKQQPTPAPEPRTITEQVTIEEPTL